MRAITIIAFFLWTQSSVYAAVTVGKAIPKLDISYKGELLLDKDTVSYKPWSTTSLEDGKVHTIQYVAGRMSASKINKPFTDKLKEKQFSRQNHHVTTIVNLNDSFIGTSALVARELRSKKKLHPKTTMVADAKGIGIAQWDLSQKNSAIVILSANKEVLFFKEGALSEQEINTVFAIIQTQIESIKSLATPIATAN